MLHSSWCFQSIWKKMMMTDAIIGIYIHWTNPYWSYSVLLLFQLTINIHHLSHLEVRGSTFRRSSNRSPCMPSEKSSFYFKQLQLPCQDQRQHSNIKKILIFDFIDEGSTPFRSKNPLCANVVTHTFQRHLSGHQSHLRYLSSALTNQGTIYQLLLPAFFEQIRYSHFRE